MRFITPEAMHIFDQRTIREFGVPGELLMERAGRGLADALWRRLRARGDVPDVTFVAGKGNNGGDAFVAARYLAGRGVALRVLSICPLNAFRGDARRHLTRLQSMSCRVEVLDQVADWDAMGDVDASEGGVCVDGILGTGVQGAARGTAAAAIRWINRCRPRQTIVAIDLPSGLDGLTGEVAGDAVLADATVTMAFPKQGMLHSGAQARCGRIEVVDIGVPGVLAEALPPSPRLICGASMRALWRPRARDGHKGRYGHVLIIGGARGYAGAVALAARGALRGGTGLVTLLTTSAAVPLLAALPEVMVRVGATTAQGVLTRQALEAAPQPLEAFDAIVVGPGLCRDRASRELVDALLAREGLRLLLDADALNVLAGELACIRHAAADVLLTPHPGEAGRLLGVSTAQVQSDRRAALRQLVAASGATVVLKGQGTWVGCGASAEALCLAGNPGMATGGTGDLLAGLIGGLWAQGHDGFEAALLGVGLHAEAGDLAAWRGSEAGLAAGDLAEALPAAIRSIAGR